MGFFDACECCGQSQDLVVAGLCQECREAEDRSAGGGKAMRRVSVEFDGEGKVVLLDPFRVTTILAGGERGTD